MTRTLRTPPGCHWIAFVATRYPRRHLAVKGTMKPLCGAKAALGMRKTEDHGLRACRSCEKVYRAQAPAA